MPPRMEGVGAMGRWASNCAWAEMGLSRVSPTVPLTSIRVLRWPPQWLCVSVPRLHPGLQKKKKKSKPPKHGSRKGQLNFFPLSSLKPRGFHSCSRDQPGDSHRTEPSTGIPCADTVIRCLFRLPTFTLPNLTGGKLLY